jgi:predicted GTPase
MILGALHSGTTRDTIDSDVTDRDGKKYTLIDTAGIRRRTSVAAGHDVPESLAVGRGLRSSTSQLNLSRFGVLHTSPCPPV